MLQVIKHTLEHLYQINRSDDSSVLVLSKNIPFHKKMDKISFEWKSMFFLFFPTSITFLVLTVIYQPYLIFETECYQHYHIAKAHSIPKPIFKVWKPNRKLVLYYGKVKETNFTSVKKANILSFLGTKRCRTEKLRLKPHNFFLEILKAVCLSIDWAPKLIQINF